MSCSAWWPPDWAALLLIRGRVPWTDVGLDAGQGWTQHPGLFPCGETLRVAELSLNSVTSESRSRALTLCPSTATFCSQPHIRQKGMCGGLIGEQRI